MFQDLSISKKVHIPLIAAIVLGFVIIVVNYIAHEIFTNIIKLDHMLFKNRAYSVVLDENAVTLNDSTACDFGKWRQGDGKKKSLVKQKHSMRWISRTVKCMII